MNPKIKIIGVGGSGSNTVSRMAGFHMQEVELVSVNTDAQALHFSKAGKKILIGFIISGLVIAALAFSFDRIVVFVIEKACSIGQFKEAYDLDIRFNHCWPTFSGQLIFDKLSIISRKTGFGFACKKAELKPIFGSKDFALDFDLRDVSFTKEAVSEEPRYDSITALAATPFDKNWK